MTAPTRFRSAYHSRWPRLLRREVGSLASSDHGERSAGRARMPAPHGDPELCGLPSTPPRVGARRRHPRSVSTDVCNSRFLFSKLGTLRLGALRDAFPRVCETSGFTPDCRFGELASTTGVSSRRFGWSVPLMLRHHAGSSLEHSATSARCPARSARGSSATPGSSGRTRWSRRLRPAWREPDRLRSVRSTFHPRPSSR